MELRHFRYFVAVAEEHSFARAAQRLHVAQPALSRQIRDLEAEVGVVLFLRLPRGVQLTPAGEAFLVEARRTLDGAVQAAATARAAAERQAAHLRFAHGELNVFAPAVERLLASVRQAHPDLNVSVSSANDSETHDALRTQEVDVGCVFVAEWPVTGFAGHRLIDGPATGVLLPASHPLAAQPAVRLADLGSLSWLHSGPQRWPGFFHTYEQALKDRGLVPLRRRERANETPSANMQVAAGDSWTLASEAVGAPYAASSTAIAYRPFVDPPIPCWIALVWLPPETTAVSKLVAVARGMGLTVAEGVRG